MRKIINNIIFQVIINTVVAIISGIILIKIAFLSKIVMSDLLFWGQCFVFGYIFLQIIFNIVFSFFAEKRIKNIENDIQNLKLGKKDIYP